MSAGTIIVIVMLLLAWSSVGTSGQSVAGRGRSEEDRPRAIS